MWLTKLRGLLVVFLTLGGIGAVVGLAFGPPGDRPLTQPASVNAEDPPQPPPKLPPAAPGEEPPRQQVEKQPWSKRLANGTVVELLGVSSSPSEPGSWWRPDGAPLKQAPYDKMGGRVYPSPDQQTREFAVRLRHLPADWGYLCEIHPAGNNQVSGMAQKDDRTLSEVAALAAALPYTQQTCTVRFGVAGGPWKTEAYGGPTGASQSGEKVPVLFGTARPFKDGSAITVSSTSVDRARRLVLVDRDGKVHLPQMQTSHDTKTIMQIDAEFAVPLAQVRDFQLQSRAYEWAEFANVRLEPKPAAPGRE